MWSGLQLSGSDRPAWARALNSWEIVHACRTNWRGRGAARQFSEFDDEDGGKDVYEASACSRRLSRSDSECRRSCLRHSIPGHACDIATARAEVACMCLVDYCFLAQPVRRVPSCRLVFPLKLEELGPIRAEVTAQRMYVHLDVALATSKYIHMLSLDIPLACNHLACGSVCMSGCIAPPIRTLSGILHQNMKQSHLLCTLQCFCSALN